MITAKFTNETDLTLLITWDGARVPLEILPRSASRSFNIGEANKYRLCLTFSGKNRNGLTTIKRLHLIWEVRTNKHFFTLDQNTLRWINRSGTFCLGTNTAIALNDGLIIVGTVDMDEPPFGG